jgi:hypothetical protein
VRRLGEEDMDLWCSGHSYEDCPWCTVDGVHAEYKAELRVAIGVNEAVHKTKEKLQDVKTC